MRKWILAGLAAAALCVPSLRAAAQDLDHPDKPLAIRIGAMWPTDTAVRKATDNIWFNLGLDYNVGRQANGNDWVAAVDFATQSSINYWAFQAIYMWRNAGEEGPRRRFSFGAGLAAYVIDADQGDSQTEWGVPIVGEWDFTSRLFLQGKYHIVASENDASSLALTAGYRF